MQKYIKQRILTAEIYGTYLRCKSYYLVSSYMARKLFIKKSLFISGEIMPNVNDIKILNIIW